MIGLAIACFLAALPVEPGVAREVSRIQVRGREPDVIRLSPRGDVLFEQTKGTVVARRLPSGSRLWSVRGKGIGVSSDGKLLATLSGKRLRILNARSGRSVASFKSPACDKPTISISANGRFVVQRYGEEEFACRSMKTGRVLWRAGINGLSAEVPFRDGSPVWKRVDTCSIALDDGGAVICGSVAENGEPMQGWWVAKYIDPKGNEAASRQGTSWGERMRSARLAGADTLLIATGDGPEAPYVVPLTLPSMREVVLDAYPKTEKMVDMWVVGQWMLAVDIDGTLSATSWSGTSRVPFEYKGRPFYVMPEWSRDGGPPQDISADGTTWAVHKGQAISIRRLEWQRY